MAKGKNYDKVALSAAWPSIKRDLGIIHGIVDIKNSQVRIIDFLLLVYIFH